MNDNNKNEYPRQEYPNHLVRSIDLCYNIIAEGHLNKLCRVSPDKKNETRRVYFFDKDENGDIQRIIDEYVEQKKAARNN